MNNWYVYIIDKEGKLYVGVTTDLENRMRQRSLIIACSVCCRQFLSNSMQLSRHFTFKKDRACDFQFVLELDKRLRLRDNGIHTS